ncbi:hypothetical protein BURKHO8Y_30249 [Burkholderia sp. 8Y]|nr:hypothetical protein BURKHO8Y_30249 [Burkholderia sp. 8Y]
MAARVGPLDTRPHTRVLLPPQRDAVYRDESAHPGKRCRNEQWRHAAHDGNRSSTRIARHPRRGCGRASR